MVSLRYCLKDFMDLSWLNITEILLSLFTCLACFIWGKTRGVEGTIGLLLEHKIIDDTDLEKLNKKLEK